jgi:hypothetical protein
MLAVPTVIDAMRQLALDQAPVAIWPVACSHLKEIAKDRWNRPPSARRFFVVKA